MVNYPSIIYLLNVAVYFEFETSCFSSKRFPTIANQAQIESILTRIIIKLWKLSLDPKALTIGWNPHELVISSTWQLDCVPNQFKLRRITQFQGNRTLVLFTDYISMKHHILAESIYTNQRPTRSTKLGPSFLHHSSFPSKDGHYLLIYSTYMYTVNITEMHLGLKWF